MPFPIERPRRLRGNEKLRSFIRETRLDVSKLVYPLFACPGTKVKQEISSMPGNHRWSVDLLVEECREAAGLGIPAVILFGIPEKKDEVGSGAYDAQGIVQQATRAVKKALPELLVITDVCLCEYTSHGHCGVVKEGRVENDPSLELLAKTALSQVEAGADLVAPSDMMDGRVGAVRHELDSHGHTQVPILAYSAKYASAFYGPFREAADSTPQFGDRKSYQMDPANAREALREIALDIEEGADIIMVKPALPYLDIINAARYEFNVPIAAYQVSGEFSLIAAASEKGWVDRDRIILESLTSIVRAGADIVLTYFAKDVARLLAR